MDQHDVQQIVDDAVDATERLIGRELDDDEREHLASEIMGDGPNRYEQRRAPAGDPTIINGKEYQGGEFIPGEALAAATPEEKQELARRTHERTHEKERKKFGYKIKRGQVDAGAARRMDWIGLDLKTTSDFAEFFGIASDIDDVNAYCVGPLLQNVQVEFDGPWGRAIRKIVQAPGGKEIHNSYIELKNKGGGLGTKMLVHEVRNAIDAGFTKITCEAAGNAADELQMQSRGKTSGYYTGYRHWPMLGFDGPIPLEVILPEQFKEAKTVLDLLSMPGGEEFWRQKGRQIDHAEFDLAPGSRSRKFLTRYLMANAQRLYGTEKPPMKFQRRS